MSQTMTASATYTTTDIEIVVRRVKADLLMIAESTGGWTQSTAQEYVHDIELLARFQARQHQARGRDRPQGRQAAFPRASVGSGAV